jgi:hypothetical protein
VQDKQDFEKQVDRYWSVLAEAGGTPDGCNFTVYRKLHVRITKSLAPDYNKKAELGIAVDDWTSDCAAAGEEKYLTREGLALSLLELASIWVRRRAAACVSPVLITARVAQAESTLLETINCDAATWPPASVPAQDASKYRAATGVAIVPFLSALVDNITVERTQWVKASGFAVMCASSLHGPVGFVWRADDCLTHRACRRSCRNMVAESGIRNQGRGGALPPVKAAGHAAVAVTRPSRLRAGQGGAGKNGMEERIVPQLIRATEVRRGLRILLPFLHLPRLEAYAWALNIASR